MTSIVPNQTFSGTANADLNTYSSSGNSWTRHPAFTQPIILTGNSSIRGNGTNGTSTLYIASLTPGTANYSVQADLQYFGSAGTNDIIGVAARYDPTADTGYFFAYRQSVAGYVLYKRVAGTATSLTASVAATIASGSTVPALKIVVQGTTISGYANGTLIMSVTDSAITAAGRTGVFIQGSASGTNTTQYQLTNFSADTLPAGPATTYTLTKSATTGPTGTAVTLTYTPDGTTTAVVTPAVSGVSGSFSASTVTLTGTTPVSVTFTPSSTGTATFSSTNNGSLTDPASQTYTVTLPAVTIPVNSAAFSYSPGNWRGDTGRGGSVYRRTWNSGAYFTAAWSQTAAGNAALNLTNATAGSTIAYVLDGTLTDAVTVPISGSIPITVNTSGSHTLVVYCRQSPQSARWAGSNSWTLTGISVDGTGTAGTAPTQSGKWVMVVGDSITEGIASNAGADSWLTDYSYSLAQALAQAGYDTGMSACGYSGWLRPGDSGADVPGYYIVTGSSGGAGGSYSASTSRWNKIDSTTSLLDSNGRISAYGGTGQEPSAIYVNYGVNEAQYPGTYSTSDTQASVNQWLTATRAAAPNAWIFIQIPPGLYNTAVPTYGSGPAYITAIKAAVAAYQAANPSDSKIKVIDLGAGVATTLASPLYNTGNLVHPLAPGHAYLAPMITAPVLTALTGVAPGVSIRTSGEVGRGR